MYERLRQAGPVSFLSRVGVWVVVRPVEIRAVLWDYETFCSSAGIGLTNLRREASWRTPSLLAESDPPVHTHMRRITTQVLSGRNLARLRPEFERRAEHLVTNLASRGEFDGVADLAKAYTLQAFPDAVGVGPRGPGEAHEVREPGLQRLRPAQPPVRPGGCGGRGRD